MLYLSCQRWLRHMQALRSAAKVQFFTESEKVSKLTQVYGIAHTVKVSHKWYWMPQKAFATVAQFFQPMGTFNVQVSRLKALRGDGLRFCFPFGRVRWWWWWRRKHYDSSNRDAASKHPDGDGVNISDGHHTCPITE